MVARFQHCVLCGSATILKRGTEALLFVDCRTCGPMFRVEPADDPEISARIELIEEPTEPECRNAQTHTSSTLTPSNIL